MRSYLAVLALLAGLPAAPASAAVLCVNTAGPQCDQAFTAAQLPGAIAAAGTSQTSLDRIEIGPGTYSSGPYNINSRVEVVGAGRDATILTNITPTGFDGPVLLSNFDLVRISDLTVRIGPGGFARGLQVAGAAPVVERVRVDAAPGSTPGLGFDGAATIRQLEVELPAGTGGSVFGGSIEDSTFVSPDLGLFLQSATARRIRASGRTALSARSARVENAVLRSSGDGGVGVDASGPSGGTVTLSHVTILGAGSPGSTGVAAVKSGGAFAPLTSTLDIRNVVVTGFAVDLRHAGFTGMGTTVCGLSCQISQNTTVSYSVLARARVSDEGGPGVLTLGDGVLDVADPRFVDAAAGDVRLRHDSALVDSGEPVGLGATAFYAGEPSLDAAGAPRIVDGRAGGDPAARRDIGAAEYGRGAPVVRLVSLAAGARLYERFAVSADASDPDPLEPLTLRFAFDGRDVPAPSQTFTTLGPHSVRVTASDPTGLAAIAEGTVEVTALPGRCANLRRGDRGRDLFAGTAAGDDLRGGAGKDRLSGGRGADCLRGGGGGDVLSGGPGADLLIGGASADVVRGGVGNDRILARDGVRDRVSCGPGRDIAVLDAKDVVRGCERTLLR